MKKTLFTLASSLSMLHASAATTTTAAKSDLICNKKGWDKGTESFLSVDYSNSYEYCAGVCKHHSDCLSFAYYLGAVAWEGGDCQLYNVPAKNNFVADESSPYMFYDTGCLAQNKQCNVRGYSKHDSWLGITTNNADECKLKCDDYDGGCVSYAYSNGECLLYEWMIADNVDVDSSSPYVFNDHLCGASVSTTTTTTTAPKTTTTTTTKKLPTTLATSTKSPTTATTTTSKTTTKATSAPSTTKAINTTTTSKVPTSIIKAVTTTTTAKAPTTTAKSSTTTKAANTTTRY